MYFVPFTREVHNLRDVREARQLSRLVDASFDRFFGDTAATQPAPRAPALDVAESDRAYTVTLDLPGVAREDVQVSVDGRRVTVRAQKQAAATGPAAAAQAGEQPAAQAADAEAGTAVAETPAAATDRIVYRERAVPSYARTFTLPVEVEQTAAGAKLDNGVLTLTLPKRHPRVAAQVTVN